MSNHTENMNERCQCEHLLGKHHYKNSRCLEPGCKCEKFESALPPVSREDRLEEIADRWPPESQDGPWSEGDPRADIAWLVVEVVRLRRQLQEQIDDKHRILREYEAVFRGTATS